MDIERVIELLRESKKKAKCPPGFKYSKKMKSCVQVKKKGKKGKYGYIRSYLGGGYRGGDNRSGNGGNGKNGNGSYMLLPICIRRKFENMFEVDDEESYEIEDTQENYVSKKD